MIFQHQRKTVPRGSLRMVWPNPSFHRGGLEGGSIVPGLRGTARPTLNDVPGLLQRLGPSSALLGAGTSLKRLPSPHGVIHTWQVPRMQL